MTPRHREANNGRDGPESARDDPGGRPVLGVMGVILIIAAIFRSDFLSVALLIVGAILVILFAFHSRIKGLLTFGKVGVPIARDDEQISPRLVYDQAAEPVRLQGRRRA